MFPSGTAEAPHILDMQVSSVVTVVTPTGALSMFLKSTEFCSEVQAQAYFTMSSFHITSYTFLRNKNSKIIILTFKKKYPLINKPKITQNIVFFLYFKEQE